MCRSYHEILAEIFLSRNLAFLLAARWPPTLTTDVRDRLLFCLLFFDRCLEGIFSIFVHFWCGSQTCAVVGKQTMEKRRSTKGLNLLPTCKLFFTICLQFWYNCKRLRVKHNKLVVPRQSRSGSRHSRCSSHLGASVESSGRRFASYRLD